MDAQAELKFLVAYHLCSDPATIGWRSKENAERFHRIITEVSGINDFFVEEVVGPRGPAFRIALPNALTETNEAQDALLERINAFIVPAGLEAMKRRDPSEKSTVEEFLASLGLGDIGSDDSEFPPAGTEWKMLHPNCTLDALGYVPSFLNAADERPAREQIDSNYQHGGGWNSINGFAFEPETGKMQYPGDPALMPIAETKLRDERIFMYQHGLCSIVQPDGRFEVARID